MNDQPDTTNLTKLCQWMLDRARAQAERHHYRFDNRHPTYNAIYDAFHAKNLSAAQEVYKRNFC